MSVRSVLRPVALLAAAACVAGVVTMAMAAGTGAMDRGCANLQRGGHGRNMLVGTATGDRLKGGRGHDRMRGRSGRDCLFGGAQGDVIRGGVGPDRIKGGRGRDRLWAGGGDDRVNSRDGLRELVRCSSGADKALVDRRDIVRGCEEVQNPAEAPTSGTTITSGPSTTVVYGSPVTFEFSSSEPGSTFECHMNGWARWQPCASPKTYPHLREGDRIFQVRATDGEGNVDSTPAQRSFTIAEPTPDTTPPETSIDSLQIHADNSITFAFSSDRPDATIMCTLDSWGVTKDCSAGPRPRTTSSLPAGDRTLTVWAVVNGVADPTPAVRTFTIGSPPPPPPPPPETDDPPFLSEFVYPRNTGKAGTQLSEFPGPGIADFDAFDYCCLHDSNNVNDRMRWVEDPGGSEKTVTEIRLVNGDNADGSGAPSGYRAEIYSQHRDLDNHEAGWQVLGFRVPTGNPAGQYGIFQNHAVGDAIQNTPPQNLNIINGQLALGIRTIGQNRVQYPIGSGAPNVWHYVALHLRFTSDNTGFVEAWAADNTLPDVSKPPAFREVGYSTLNGGRESSRSHIGFYERDFTGRIFYCGYHRAATYTEASGLPNCPISR